MFRTPVVFASQFSLCFKLWRNCAGLLLVLSVLAATSGCTGDFKSLPSVSSMDSEDVPIGNLSGSVHGGQAPIWNSHVYLMKATTGGYGLASLSMLKATGGNTTADTTVLGTTANPAYYVTSDGTGNWNITGDYTCSYNTSNPALSDQLYMLSLNGNTSFLPGTPPTGGAMNPAIGLMAVLGQCPSNGTFAGHLNYIIMNEVSTVAAGYALAGFATSSYNEIDTSGNVWATTTSNVMEYSNSGTLIAGSPYTDGGAFASAIGITSDGSGNTYVANTAGTNGAIVNFAPNGNFIKISGSGTNPTYTTLSSTNLFLGTISQNNYSQPTYVAADQADYFWSTLTATNQIARIGPTGTAVFRGAVGSLNAPTAVALDSANNGWTTWNGSNAVTKTTSTGSSTTYTGAGLNGPKGVAIDGANNVFAANSVGTVSEGTSAGAAVTVPASGTGGTTGYAAQSTLGTTTGIAVDISGNVWTTNNSTSTLTEFIGLGVPVVTPLAAFTGIASNSLGNKP